MSNLTKKQHYVPEFYLSKFKGPTGKLEIYDKRHGAFGLPKSPGQLGYEDYYYSQTPGQADPTSQRTEELFQCLESEVGRKYDHICNQLLKGDSISMEDKWTLSLHVASLWCRGHWLRQNINRMANQLALTVLKRQVDKPEILESLNEHRLREGRPPTTRENLEGMVNGIENGEILLTPSNHFHLAQLGDFDKYARAMYVKEMWVYLAKGEAHFLTSDIPVSTLTTASSVQALGRPRNFMEQIHALPLTPDVLLEFVDQDKGNVRFMELDDESVFAVNARQIAGAHAWIAGVSRGDFRTRSNAALQGLPVLSNEEIFDEDFQQWEVTVI